MLEAQRLCCSNLRARSIEPQRRGLVYKRAPRRADVECNLKANDRARTAVATETRARPYATAAGLSRVEQTLKRNRRLHGAAPKPRIICAYASSARAEAQPRGTRNLYAARLCDV